MFQTLTYKVILVTLIFLGVFVIAVTCAITNIFRIRDATSYLGDHTVQQVKLSGDFNTDLFRGFAEALAYARTRTPDNRASALQEMHDAQIILDQLTAIEAKPNLYAPELGAALDELQQRRGMVYRTIQPKIATLMQAQDENTLNQALDALNAQKGIIEQLEEDTGSLAEQAITAANNTIAQRTSTALLSAGLSLILGVLLVPVIIVVLRRQIILPIKGLAAAAQAVAGGNLNQAIAVTTTDEIGDVQGAFNQMIVSLASTRAAVGERQHALEDRTIELERTFTELHKSTNEREQLNATVRALSSPVIPVLDGVLVMPLIGVVDSERAALMMDSLLAAIEHHHAKFVILDITGVPLVDTHVAQVLLHAAQASKLLGAQAILVGLRPELAQTIIGLGLDLAGIMTRADLQSGINFVLKGHREEQRTVGSPLH